MQLKKQNLKTELVVLCDIRTLSINAMNLLLATQVKLRLARETLSRLGEFRHAIDAIIALACGHAVDQIADSDNLDLTALHELDGWMSSLRLSDPRMKTIESRARAAIRAVNIPLRNGHGRGLLTTEWLAFQSLIDDTFFRKLNDFPNVASSWGIAPQQVSRATLDHYAVKKFFGHAAKGARQRYLLIVDTWTAILDDLGVTVPDDFPGRRYGVYRYCFDRVRFNRLFLDEVTAAAACITSQRLPWREPHPDAATKTTQNLLRLASAVCRQQRRLPSELSSIAELCVPQTARAGLQFMTERNLQLRPNKYHFGAYQAACLICEVAEAFVCVDKNQRMELRDLRCGYAPKFSPELSIDKQIVIRRFVDRKSARALRRLPHEIFQELAGAPNNRNAKLRLLGTAIAIELGLKYALWPSMIAGCVVRTVNDRPVKSAPVEIVHDPTSGQTVIYVRKNRRGAERQHEISGATLALLTEYWKIVDAVVPRTDGAVPLLYGRNGRNFVASSVSRNIAELLTVKFGTRITAGHLPSITATIVLCAPTGTRNSARILLGRGYYEFDRLLDSIERWLEVDRLDRRMMQSVPLNTREDAHGNRW